LYSSVADLARWIAFQTGRLPGSDEVLSASSRAEMQRPVVIADDGWTEGQGLGWYTTRRGDTMLAGHDGELNGFSTSIRFDPRRGVGAIVLLNGIGSPGDLAFDLAEAVLDERGDASPARRRPSPVPDALAPFLGAYVMPEFGDRASVEWRDDRLVIVVAGDLGEECRDLEPLGPGSFAVGRDGGRGAGEHVLFERDGNGRVTGMEMGGYSYVRLRPARPPRA
ncbi:MAG TPA: serine hydrolase domain-containing protein, partial [Actinomycetota bacterium]|nr:serine hydrolase domain-containing protein [Actinomycetota bacterium]